MLASRKLTRDRNNLDKKNEDCVRGKQTTKTYYINLDINERAQNNLYTKNTAPTDNDNSAFVSMIRRAFCVISFSLLP